MQEYSRLSVTAPFQTVVHIYFYLNLKLVLALTFHSFIWSSRCAPHAWALVVYTVEVGWPLSKAVCLAVATRKHTNRSEWKVSCNWNTVSLRACLAPHYVKTAFRLLVLSPRACSCWLLWLRHQLWEDLLIIMPFKTLMPRYHSKCLPASLLPWTVKCLSTVPPGSSTKLTPKIIKLYDQKR